jgi:hypothetical protein
MINWLRRLCGHDDFTDMEKRETVIAKAVASGKPCYPVNVGSQKDRCLLCNNGACHGPIEKWQPYDAALTRVIRQHCATFGIDLG